MKEAFELIKERLEAIWVDNRCGDCVYKSVCDKVQEEAIVNDQTDLCGVTIKTVALSIVSEVEAEYINKSTEHINKSGDCSTNWIPCSERLPEDFQSVLCYAESIARSPDTIFVGSQKHGCWFLQSSIGTESFPTQYKVVAWLPLPEPYKPTND